jgi:acyl-CoA reductase-like NAD-dependent aldehyde dehydrogenase
MVSGMLLEEAVNDSVKLMVGDLKRNGIIIQPHLIDRVKPTNKAYIEESFGPLFTVSRVNGYANWRIITINCQKGIALLVHSH